MKTKYFFLAAAAALFAACSSDDGIAEQQQAKQQAEQVPVAFDSYVNRTTTRAGATGIITTNGVPAGTTSLQTAELGFGVFGYYTNADNYDQTFTPNFMYNQHVTFASSKWSYLPVKYWPNEFGSNAASDDRDKVSFFAYAPYVTVNPTSGKVKKPETATYDNDNGDTTYGIVGMKANNATGDPMVKYIASFYTDKQVDLLWATIPSSQKWLTKQAGTDLASNWVAGTPWLNVEHPTTTSTDWTSAQKVSFDFKHGLAAMVINVDTYANKPTPAGSAGTAADETKVYIRSVTFEGFDTKGALNLNNSVKNKAFWYNFNCLEELNNGSETTIKDGRKDGKEGLTAATKEYAAINPDFVQSTIWGSTSPAEAPGVTEVAANLFCTSATPAVAGGSTDPIFVIPNNDPLKITIEYDVLTADPNLAGTLNDGKTPGSVVKNVITRYITTGEYSAGDATTAANGIVLENGNKYTINLHLGLNSVEFDASVTGWDDAKGGASLPHNN